MQFRCCSSAVAVPLLRYRRCSTVVAVPVAVLWAQYRCFLFAANSLHPHIAVIQGESDGSHSDSRDSVFFFADSITRWPTTGASVSSAARSALLAGFTAALLALAAPLSAQEIAGTYRIAVCKGAPCSPDDTTSAVVWGTLVLGDTAIALATIPSGIGRQLTFMYPSAQQNLNGCYVLSRVTRRVRTEAGVRPVAATIWAPTAADPSTITSSLFRTVDAAHSMQLRFENGRLNGTGHSAGMGVPSVGWGPDTIVAVRAGPPNYSLCTDAAAVPDLRARAVQGKDYFFEWPSAAIDSTMRYVIHVPPLFLIAGRPPSAAANRGVATSLWDPGTVVIMPPRTDAMSQAALIDSVSDWVRRLRQAGLPPQSITVSGGGDATAVALAVSARVTDPIGYVLLGGCDPAAVQTIAGPLHGEVLSLIHPDAPTERRCETVFSRSTQLVRSLERSIEGTSAIEFYRGTSSLWADLVSDWIRFRRLGP